MNKNKKDSHGIIKNMLYILKLIFSASPGLVIFNLIVKLLSNLPSRLISVIGIKYVIDEAVAGGDVRKIISAILVILIVFLVEAFVRSIFYNLYFNKKQELVYYEIHKKLYDKAKSMDLSKFDNSSFYSDFILAIETSSDNIQNILNLVIGYITEIISFLSISSIIFTIDPVCLLIILFFVGISIPITKKIGNLQMERRVKITEKHRKADYFARLFYLQDYAAEIRVNSLTPLLLNHFRKSADDIKQTQEYYIKRIESLYALIDVFVHVLGFMLILCTYIGYKALVLKEMTPGDFVAAFNGSTQIGNSLNFLFIWGIRNFTERSKMIEKYRVFLKTENNLLDGAHSAKSGEPETIELQDVSFTYDENDKPSLSHINMTIHPHEKIALVGYNGAGKTTLTNLLLRLYDVSDGKILIGGRDIREEKIKSHRDRFSAVFQDFKIFAGTVGENVALSNEYDEKKVWEALRAAGFSKELPNGVETHLQREFNDDGLMLSGGESQKITIARAFYKNCPYVIFDEPSANLDPISEYELNRSMAEAAKEKTVIFISHRLSTTRHADRIFMMEKGSIIESGTHDELMALNGKYAYMFRLQAEKYQDS